MQTCRLCGSDHIVKSKEITSPINELVYSLFKCNDCKSLLFDSKEHEIDLQEMYNTFDTRGDFPLDFKPTKKWEKEKKLIIKYANIDIASILDVGCRTGDFLMHFPDSLNRVGVELGKEFSEIALKRGLNIHHNFLENIELSESFDVVTCYAILEHLENPVVFLESLTSIVTKGGVLVVMIPTFQSGKTKILEFFKLPWHMYSPPEHLNFYSRKFLDAYLKNKGFLKVSRRYSSGGMLFINSGIFKKVDDIISQIIDNTFLCKLPFFDHMYSYYKKSA